MENATEKLEFIVRSSPGDGAYRLTANRIGLGIRFMCSCPAAENGTHCKHRLALLIGDLTSLVSEDSNNVEELIKMVSCTSLANAILELTRLENEFEKAKQKLSKHKKIIARLMYGSPE